MQRTKQVIATLFYFLFSMSLYAQPAFQCDGSFYINKANKLYALNFNWETAETELIAFPGDLGFTRMGALAYNRADNYIYGIGEAEGEAYFLRIDASGNAVVLKKLEIDGWQQATTAGTITNDGKYFLFPLTKGSISPNVPSRAMGIIDISLLRLEVRPLTSQVGELALLLGDIATHPITDSIYSYARFTSGGGSLVYLNKSIPQFDDSTFPTINSNRTMESLFFDSFGQLWGLSTRFLYKINTLTGRFEQKTIDDISAFDGCSCPFAIGFQKKVSNDTITPCSDIQYTFLLSNLTEKAQSGLQFRDDFPPGFVITEILRNPFGETVQGLGTNVLSINDMEMNYGVDSIVVRVQVPPDADGLYFNQARLSNIDFQADYIQSNTLFSDNPATLERNDPTPIFIKPLEVALENQIFNICQDSTIELIPLTNSNDFQYEWDDGSTDNSLTVSTPGNYSVTITSGCSTTSANYEVRLSTLSVTLDVWEEAFFGKPYEVGAFISASSAIQGYLWEFGDTSILSSQPRVRIRPVSDLSVKVTVTDEFGCTAMNERAISVLRGIYTPTAFSPNGDGINDWFFIQTPGPVPIKSMWVFDRWGGLVFERRNILSNTETDGWDGRQNNQVLENGLYIWWAELDFGVQGKEVLKGEVLIVK